MEYACGGGSIAVKGTEVNRVNSLKIKHFRELEVFFRLSDFFVLGDLLPGEIEG